MRGAGDVPVLDRIEMDVVQMPFIIALVADRMFPEAPLPDTTTAIPPAGFADRPFPSARRHPCLGE